MDPPLREAITKYNDSKYQKKIFLLTDGQDDAPSEVILNN